MAVGIQSVAEQNLLIDTTYRLRIRITGNPSEAWVTGNLRYFSQDWDSAARILTVYGHPLRLESGQTWIVHARDRDNPNNVVTADILYNVNDKAPIIGSLPDIHLYREVETRVEFQIQNLQGFDVESLLTGLNAEVKDGLAIVDGEISEDDRFSVLSGDFRVTASYDGGVPPMRDFPFQIESGAPPQIGDVTVTPKGNYAEISFEDLDHAIGYQHRKVGDEVWSSFSEHQPLIDPGSVKVVLGNLSATVSFGAVVGANLYQYKLNSESHNVDWTTFVGTLSQGAITFPIDDLEEGVEYDVELRVFGPWIGDPITIKVYSGRIVAAAYWTSPNNSLVFWNIGTIPLLENDANLKTPQIAKRILMPSDLPGVCTAIAIDSDTETAYVAVGRIIYVFGYGDVENNGRATLAKSFTLPSTSGVFSLAFFDGKLYIRQNVSSSQSPSAVNYTAYIYNVPADIADKATAVGSDFFGSSQSSLINTRSISVTDEWIYYFTNNRIYSISRVNTDYRRVPVVLNQQASLESNDHAKRVGDQLYSMDIANGALSDANLAVTNQFLKRWVNGVSGFRDMDVLV